MGTQYYNVIVQGEWLNMMFTVANELEQMSIAKISEHWFTLLIYYIQVFSSWTVVMIGEHIIGTFSAKLSVCLVSDHRNMNYYCPRVGPKSSVMWDWNFL